MKKFLCMVIIFVAGIFSAASAQGVWRLDGTDADEIPRNWRTMIDAWRVENNSDDGTHDGLEKLHASASGQPSLPGLTKVYEAIAVLAEPNANIYILDLREESHGFADDYPVSWYVEKNRGNYWRGADDIEQDEIERLENLRGKLTEIVPLGNYDKAHYQAIKISPKETSTEKDAARAAGFIYVRFGATDMMFPSPQIVEKFLNFTQTLREKDWVHFHCQAGHGRTTIFLVMYDILKNPDLPLEDICKRQYYLGGSNLLANKDYAEGMKNFYRYVHENHGETWSEFLSAQK